MSTTRAAPGSIEERTIVLELVATEALRERNAWQSYAFDREAALAGAHETIAALCENIEELERRVEWQAREIRALRWTNGARERTTIRQLQQIRDLTRRLPRVEQHAMSPQEGFRIAHPIADVIGQVVDLMPVEEWRASQTTAEAIRSAVGLPPLAAAGSGYLVGRCPLCPDKHPSPSLAVRPDHEQFCCYRCGAAGDAIRFLELYRARGAA